MTVQNLAQAIQTANDLHRNRDVAAFDLDHKIRTKSIPAAEVQTQSNKIQALTDQIPAAEAKVVELGMNLLKVMLERNGHYDEAALLTHYMKLPRG